MTNKPERPFNSRTYQGHVERELILGGIIITLVLGGGLVAFIWGGSAFFAAMGCFALVLGLIGVVWLVLKLIEIAARG